jgi:hypothetical protein
MAKQSYVSASAQNKRELVISLSSNRYVAGEHVVVEPRFPLNVLENRALVTGGDQRRVTSRTMKRLARRLWEGAKKEGQEEDDRQAA